METGRREAVNLNSLPLTAPFLPASMSIFAFETRLQTP